MRKTIYIYILYTQLHFTGCSFFFWVIYIKKEYNWAVKILKKFTHQFWNLKGAQPTTAAQIRLLSINCMTCLIPPIESAGSTTAMERNVWIFSDSAKLRGCFEGDTLMNCGVFPDFSPGAEKRGETQQCLFTIFYCCFCLNPLKGIWNSCNY